MDRLGVNDAEQWHINAHNTLRLLHKYKARDFAQFLDIFDRETYDWQGEPLIFHKADDLFFERVVGLLPMYIKEMTNEQVVRCFEVMTKRNIGS